MTSKKSAATLTDDTALTVADIELPELDIPFTDADEAENDITSSTPEEQIALQLAREAEEENYRVQEAIAQEEATTLTEADRRYAVMQAQLDAMRALYEANQKALAEKDAEVATLKAKVSKPAAPKKTVKTIEDRFADLEAMHEALKPGWLDFITNRDHAHTTSYMLELADFYNEVSRLNTIFNNRAKKAAEEAAKANTVTEAESEAAGDDR